MICHSLTVVDFYQNASDVDPTVSLQSVSTEFAFMVCVVYVEAGI